MSKRLQKFARNPRDSYATPYSAVLPLLPHLPSPAFFDEPCCGDGDLVRHLHSHGHCVSRATDISGGDEFDALKIRECTAKMFITNPPWSWPILGRIIPHLSRIAPTWLLLSADLMHNKRMSKNIAQCAKIVSVGRVSWMQNGTSGFDNCAWYLFDKNHVGGTVFIPRAVGGGGMIEAIYAPRNQFLALLAQGWRLPFIVEPMQAHHGKYSILLERQAR